jgi:Domain of unknown function (DUF6766)
MISTSVVGWIRDRGLTLFLLLMFALFLVGQLATGLAEYNAAQQEHGQPLVTLNTYLGTGQTGACAAFRNGTLRTAEA